jgi:hypothetical protein
VILFHTGSVEAALGAGRASSTEDIETAILYERIRGITVE